MKPTEAQMAQLERLEADYERAIRDGVDEMVWQVRRRPSPNAVKIRVAPGVIGRLVQWGDGTWRMPSVAFVKTADVGKFLKQCRAQIDVSGQEPSQDTAAAAPPTSGRLDG